MAGWASLPQLVRAELKQRREEGCDVAGFEERIERAGDDRERLMELYRELMELPVSPSFPIIG